MKASAAPEVSLALHGGASDITPRQFGRAALAPHRRALLAALRGGYRALRAGATALEVVEAVVAELEDCPLFNAGRGAAYTAAERHSLDASIMCGHRREAGGAAGLSDVRNPVRLARAVLEHSPHVLLAGAGAADFARERGLELVPEAYFGTEQRLRSLQRARGRAPAGAAPTPCGEGRYGTVGAVARDRAGHLAAATSTGGTTNQLHGRVSDSALVGAGTFAWDGTCAVSATGRGDPFIRLGAAARVSAWMELGGLALHDAVARVLDEVGELGGTGGLIAVDRDGRICLDFRTRAMYRGWIEAGRPRVAVFPPAGAAASPATSPDPPVPCPE